MCHMGSLSENKEEVFMKIKRLTLTVTGLVWGTGGRVENLRNFRKQTFLSLFNKHPNSVRQ